MAQIANNERKVDKFVTFNNLNAYFKWIFDFFQQLGHGSNFPQTTRSNQP